MRSPGAMIPVVNTPDNIPAANSCGYLWRVHTHTHAHNTQSVSQSADSWRRLSHQWQQQHLRQNIVWGSLLQLLSQTEPEEADGKHGRDPNDWRCHAFVESFHPLCRREKGGRHIEAQRIKREHSVKDEWRVSSGEQTHSETLYIWAQSAREFCTMPF